MTSEPFLKHVASIPYSDPPTRLQTLETWLPRPVDTSDPTKTLWIIYIHGGAWRDPLQDSSCILPTLRHLFSPTYASTLPSIGGIASLNYRLSPYAAHPTHPSAPDDAERSAKHPQHVRDVARGVKFLLAKYGVKRWIGVGHSCGATLLLQLVAGIGVDAQCKPSIGPEALLLLEGIYNFSLLLRNHVPPSCPEHIARVYVDFIAGAFGRDQACYAAVSPVAGKFGKEQWKEGKLVIICHSYEDELVERLQRDVMCVALDREGWEVAMEVGDEGDELRSESRRVLNVRDVKGGHDWIWEDGDQIARLIVEVVERLI